MAKTIGIDTPVLIYLLQGEKKYVAKARALMRRVQSGEYHAVFSSIGLIEVLTGPKKEGEYELAATYREIITHFPNLAIIGVNERVVDISSNLRARYGISTPDAIHIATAISEGAHAFITNDKALRKIQELPVELL